MFVLFAIMWGYQRSPDGVTPDPTTFSKSTFSSPIYESFHFSRNVIPMMNKQVTTKHDEKCKL